MRLRIGRVAVAFTLIGLLVLAILLMTSGPKTPQKPVNVPKPLVDYASSSATVSLTTKGEINAQEQHREIRVRVGRDFRKLEVIRGYENEVIKEQDLSNTQAAYSEFLYALTYANFTKQRDSTIKSENGVCPLGNRYVFELEQGGRQISRLWTSTCSGIGKGTFGGNTIQLLTLFENQIPNYDRLTARVRLQ